MRTFLVALLATLASVLDATASVIVVANYTTDDVTITVTEPGAKAQEKTIPAYHVIPIAITGPADLKLPASGHNAVVRVDLAHAYALIPDRAKGLRIECLEMPGQPPERDARPELNPIPRTPVRIPVTLLVDDVDPRTDPLWQAEIRKRFDAAAAILEAQTGFRFEFAGFETWKSNSNAKDLGAQLLSLEDAVKVKPGALAIGFTSQKLDDAKMEFGLCRGLGSSHLVIREWRPKSEPERLEVLVRFMALTLGAVSSPDPGSVMRPKLGDGRALHTGYVIRLDPLNALALNLMADLRRSGVTQLDAVPLQDRSRLIRVYSALLQASPGDPVALDYLAVLDKDVANVDPKNPNAGAKKEPLRAADQLKRTEATRLVVQAIAMRAKANAGSAALTGDALTIALVRAAEEAARKLPEPDRVSAFLLGLGVGLDDTRVLGDDPLTSGALAEVETKDERVARVAVLGNPTLYGRRDLCRRFVEGCAAGELLTPTAAENEAIGRSLFEKLRPTGLSFPALAAEFAGIAFARTLRENPEIVFKGIKERFTAQDLIPDVRGLRDGIGPDKFDDEFGGTDDERFRAVIAEIRKRVQGVSANKTKQ